MRLETLILNANETLPENGVAAVQVAPFGEFAGVLHLPGGKTREIVQVLDRAAFERILKAWNEAGAPELLVDLDHLSATGGSTRAAAWAGNLRIEEGAGLVADFAFTAEGRRIIDGREYRFVSPVFECGEDGEVLRLESVALTNRPNLPVRCILNQKEFPDSPENPARPEKQEPKGTDMEKILSALGLPPPRPQSGNDMTAAEKILQKALAASSIDSREWNAVQAGLRDRAFFSSTVASVRFLHAAREMAAAQAAGGMSESEIRRDLRRLLAGENYDPGDKANTIQDLRTRLRLDLIIKTNVQ